MPDIFDTADIEETASAPAFPVESQGGGDIFDMVTSTDVGSAGVAAEQPSQAATAVPLWERIKNARKSGQLDTELGLLRAQQIYGNETPEIDDRIAEIKAGKGKLEDPVRKERSWWDRAVTGAANMTPIMESGIKEGTKRGVTTGAAAGLAAAVGGQMGPQVAVPEELVTVPLSAGTAFAIGMTSGTMQNIGEIEAGLAYDEMVDLVDEAGNKIDPTTAKTAAAAVGVINAALEGAQISTLVKSFPGGREALSKLVRSVATKKIKEIATKKGAKAAAVATAKGALKYGKDVATETGQELLQETTNIVATEVAKKVNNELKGTDLEGATAEQITDRLKETAVESALSFAALSAPGHTLKTSGNVRNALKTDTEPAPEVLPPEQQPVTDESRMLPPPTIEVTPEGTAITSEQKNSVISQGLNVPGMTESEVAAAQQNINAPPQPNPNRASNMGVIAERGLMVLPQAEPVHFAEPVDAVPQGARESGLGPVTDPGRMLVNPHGLPAPAAQVSPEGEVMLPEQKSDLINQALAGMPESEVRKAQDRLNAPERLDGLTELRDKIAGNLLKKDGAPKKTAGARALARLFALNEQIAALTPTTTPEAPATMEAQMRALTEGRKPAVLVTPGEALPEVPDGFKTAKVPEGTLIFSQEGTLNLARSGRLGSALGYGIDGKPEGAETVVTARDQDGTVIQDVVTDGSQEVMDAAQTVAGEDGTVEVRPAEDAIAEREAGQGDHIVDANEMVEAGDRVGEVNKTIPDAKEPWQMTQAEWNQQDHNITFSGADSYYHRPDGKKVLHAGTRSKKKVSARQHEHEIKRALRDGKPVPDEVLAEYPGLQKNAEDTSESEQTPDAPDLPSVQHLTDEQVSPNTDKRTIYRAGKQQALEAIGEGKKLYRALFVADKDRHADNLEANPNNPHRAQNGAEVKAVWFTTDKQDARRIAGFKDGDVEIAEMDPADLPETVYLQNADDAGYSDRLWLGVPGSVAKDKLVFRSLTEAEGKDTVQGQEDSDGLYSEEGQDAAHDDIVGRTGAGGAGNQRGGLDADAGERGVQGLAGGGQEGTDTEVQAGDSDPAAAGLAPLHITPLSDKTFLVKGDTKPHKNRLGKKGLKGWWDHRHKGWAFPKTREAEVREALQDLLEVPAETKQPPSYVKPKMERSAFMGRVADILERHKRLQDNARNSDRENFAIAYRKAYGEAVTDVLNESLKQGADVADAHDFASNLTGAQLREYSDSYFERAGGKDAAPQTDNPQSLDAELADMDMDDLSAMFDEVAGEQIEEAAAKQEPAESGSSAEKAIADRIVKIADQITQQGTNKGRRPMDTKWEPGAVKRMTAEVLKGILGGRQFGKVATAKVNLAKAKSANDLRSIAAKLTGEQTQRAAEEAPITTGAQTASKIAAEAAKHGVKGVSEAMQGLVDLFGGANSLKSFPSGLNRDTYEQAKPHFQKALEEFRAAGKGVKDFLRFIVENFSARVKPYLMHFLDEVKNGDMLSSDEVHAGKDNINDRIEETGAAESREPVRDDGEGTAGESDSAPGRVVPETAQGADEVEAVATADAESGAKGAPGNQSTDGSRVPKARGRRGRSSRVHPDQAGRGSDRENRGRRDLEPQETPASNYRIPDDFELGRGETEKYADNLAAIRILKTLQKEKRFATAEEQQALALYVGWGGLANAFRRPDGSMAKGWESKVEELEGLLTEKELEVARNSTQFAHYTSKDVVDALWKIAEHVGFKGGNVLEPAMGAGNFLGLVPQNLAGRTLFTGVEYDPLTAGIATALYPQSNVIHSGFEKIPLPPNYFDLVIGNPPFSQNSLRFKYTPDLNRFSMHNQFMLAGIEALKPGGVQVFVVSRYFLDAKSGAARAKIAEQADLVAAFRLPDTAFKANAGTTVITDIVVLQKKTDAAGESAVSWVETTEVADPLGGDPITVNEYFKSHPQNIIGTLDRSGSHNMHNDVNVHLEPGTSLADRVEACIQGLPENILAHETPQDRARQAFQDLRASIDVALRGAEIGHVIFNAKGDLVQVYEKEAPGGGELYAERVLSPDSPWHNSLQQNESGQWYEIVDKLDKQGKPAKVVGPDGKPTKLNQKEARVYDRIADIPGTKRLGKLGYARLKGAVEILDSLIEQINLENTQDASNQQIEANRKKLKRQYQAFVKEHGCMNSSKILRIVDALPNGALLRSLEAKYQAPVTKARAKTLGVEPRGAIVKTADILEKRIVYPYEVPTSAESAIDALAVVLSETGGVDLDRIAELTGQPVEKVIDELHTAKETPVIFKDPETGRWETADEYLGGNVARKLEAAKQAEAEKNVAALEKVQPEPWTADKVTVSLGATWVPAQVYAAFVEHLTGAQGRVQFSRLTNTFSVTGDASTGEAKKWNTPGRDAVELLGNIMNSQAIRVTRTVSDGHGGTQTFVDTEATQAANDMAETLKEEFTEWVFRDSDRRRELVALFNRKFNVRVTKQRDGSHLKFPGKVPDAIIKLRRHQVNGIWRGIVDRFVLYDHAVGSGKTFTAIARAMERKRMGLSKKPMMVVPNHILEQVAKDVYTLYPGAKVLAAGTKDLSKNKRKRLFARIATGDWDLVIVPHSSFRFIGISPATEERYLQEELDLAIQAVEEAEAEAEAEGLNNGRRKPLTVKEAERLRDNIEARLEKVREAAAKRDNLLTFEQMGVDDLTVDESHEFKNLFYHSRLNVRGMNPKAGSSKAYDLWSKVRVLRDSKNGSVAFMTGTPISNSAVELYGLMRYLAADTLEEMGLEHFDAWRNQFATVSTAFEPKESGRGLKEVNRIGRDWSNMRSLMDLYYAFADTVSNEDIQTWYKEDNDGAEFPIPKVKGGGRRSINVEPSEVQERIIEQIVAGFEALPDIRDVDERNAERLRLMDRARKVSLDARAVDPYIQDNGEGGKLAQAAVEIKRVYDAWQEDRGTQLVFLDRSVPKAKGDAAKIAKYNSLVRQLEQAEEAGDEAKAMKLSDQLEKYDHNEMASLTAAQQGDWNAYDEIRKRLIESGIPADEIRYVQEATTDDQKKLLFEEVNAGKVRVLFGSTPRMGAGTNVQERLVALHHVDVTWKPSDIEQREGRIIRQGNKLLDKYGDKFEVEILAYTTNRTVDAKLWSLNATKLKMINGLRHYTGDFNIEFDDSDSVGMAEIAAIASGEPLQLERVQLTSEIDKLNRQKSAHRRRLYGMKDELDDHKRALRNEEQAAVFEKHAGIHASIEEQANRREVTLTHGDEMETFGFAQAAEAKARITQLADAAAEGGDKFTINVDGKKYTAKTKAHDAVQKSLGDGMAFEAEFEGDTYISRSAMDKAITQKVQDAIEANLDQADPQAEMDETPIGSVRIGDLDVQVSAQVVLGGRMGGGKQNIEIFAEAKDGKTQLVNTNFLGAFGKGGKNLADVVRGLAASIAREVRGFPAVVRQFKERADKAREMIPKLESLVDEPFPKEQELAEKERRLEEVERELSAEADAASETDNDPVFSRNKEQTVPVTKVEPFDVPENELWRTANEFYRENLQGKTVEASRLGEVRFSKEGRSKALHVGRRDARRMSMVRGLEGLIENAVPLRETEDTKGRPDIGKYIYALSPVSLDGEVYAVRLVLREEAVTGGRRFYTFMGYKLEPSAIDRGDVAEAPLPVRGSLDSTVTVAQLKEAVKNDPAFSSTNPQQQARLTKQQVLQTIGPIAQNWKNAPRIEAVQSIKDLPTRLKDYILSHDPYEGAGIDGVFDPKTDTIFLIADGLPSAERAQHVLLHEVVGHYGLRGVFGKDFNRILDQIGTVRLNDLRPIAVRWGYDLRTRGGRRGAAEEWLAEIAGRGETNGFWKRAIAAIRSWLREMGFNLKLSDADIVAMIAKARRYVEQGGEGAGVKEAPTFSRAPAAAIQADQAPRPGRVDRAKRSASCRLDYLRMKFQDKFLPLKRTQQALKQQGWQEREDNNPYLAEELYHGIAKDRLDKFEAEQIAPMMEAIKAAPVSLEELEQYLYAKHAPERNAYIQKINQNFEDGGSGMTDHEAAAAIDRFRKAGKLRTLHNLAQKVWAMAEMQRDIIREEGLEEQERLDAWEQFNFYVPLKGAPDGLDAGHGRSIGRGFAVSRSGTRSALGRRSQAENILAHLAAQTADTIVRAERAKVGKAFLQMVEENPDPSLWTVRTRDDLPTRQVLAKNPAFTALQGKLKRRQAALGKAEDGAEIERLQQEIADIRTEMEATPPRQVSEVDDFEWIRADNVLPVTRDGKVHYIQIENQDLARVMKNLGAADQGKAIRALAWVNRVLAMVNTSLNPEFVVTNFERDFQTAMINLSGEQSAKAAAKTAQGIPAAMRGIRNALRGKNNSDMAKWYARFKAAGGQVGYLDLQSVDQTQHQIQKLVREQDGKLDTVWKFARKVGKFVGDYNTMVENAVRLSAFKTAIENGMSEAKAASLAKNLTVNFNRKGELGPAANALYLFFNAGVQGSARIVAGLAKSKRTRKICAGITLAAFALAEMNRLQAGDDDDDENRWDKVSEYTKSTNLLVMRGDGSGDAFKVKLPYGYNLFVALGYTMSDVRAYLTSDGKHGKSPAKGAVSLFHAAMNAFNPLGGDESLLQMASPTIADPFVQVATNENFMGTPIRPEQPSFGPPKPRSELYWSSVRPMSKAIAKQLNELTGGNSVEPGVVDISPEVLDHFWDFVTGGGGRFYADGVNAMAAMAKGDETPIRRIPFARQAYQEKSEFYDRQHLHDNMDQVAAHYGLFKEMMETGRKGDAMRYRQEHPEIKLKRTVNALRQRLSRLRQGKEKLENVDKQRYKDRIERIEQEIQRLTMAFNRKYNQTVTR